MPRKKKDETTAPVVDAAEQAKEFLEKHGANADKYIGQEIPDELDDLDSGLEALEEAIENRFRDKLMTFQEPIPKDRIKSRVGWSDRGGNNHMVEYVEWHFVADRLDVVAPLWSSEIKSLTFSNGMAICILALTIDGVTREGLGIGGADSEMGLKKAEHDALKRAAVKFGVARELYSKEADIDEQAGQPTGYRQSGGGSRFTENDPSTPPSNPVAASAAEILSDKQANAIGAICRNLGIDENEECNAVLKCNVKELSRKGASWFITYLDTPSVNSRPRSAVSPDVANSLPTQPAQPASVAQGRMIEMRQVNALRMLCNKLGISEGEQVLKFTANRTNQIKDMSVAEGQAMYEALSVDNQTVVPMRQAS